MKNLLSTIILLFIYSQTVAQTADFKSQQKICKDVYLFNFTNGKGEWNKSSAECSNIVNSVFSEIRGCSALSKDIIYKKGVPRKEPIVNTADDIYTKYRSSLVRNGAKETMFGTVTENNNEITFTLEYYELTPWRKIGTYRHVFTKDQFSGKGKTETIRSMVSSLISGIPLTDQNQGNSVDIRTYIRPVSDSTGDHEIISGATDDGKVAFFSIMYLTKEKRWEYGSTKKLHDGSKLEDVIKKVIPNFQEFSIAKGLIAVGVASQEGDLIEKEELRADTRADMLLFLLKSINNDKEMYKLNLGKDITKKTGLDHDETSYQRRVIVIAIIDKDPSMRTAELKIALSRALAKSEGIKFNIETHNYSLFDFTRER